MINLTWLDLHSNQISEVSPLANLINLTTLSLSTNNISDLSPLVANTGLGSGDEVDVRNNPLSATSINTHIPALQGRGVYVRFGTSKPAVPIKMGDLNTIKKLNERLEDTRRLKGQWRVDPDAEEINRALVQEQEQPAVEERK